MNSPKHWSNCTLEDCVDILDSQRIPINQTERQNRIANKESSSLYPYYGATGRVGYIDDYIFDEELILLGEDGVPFLDPFRTKAYAISGKAWVNNHAHVLRVKSSVYDQRLLLHYLNQFNYRSFVTGTTRLKLNQRAMKSMPVVLPPLIEQKQIADKLDVLLARVDACRERLERVPQILQCLRQSVLTTATSGEFTEDWRYEHQESLDIPTVVAQINERRKSLVSTLSMKKGSKGIPKLKSSLISVQHNSDVVLPPSWFWTSLESLAAIEPYSMTSGPFGSALGTKDYRSNGVPVIRAQNIQEGRFQSDNFVFISSEKAEELNRSKAKPGDLVVVAVGSSGRAALVPDTLKLAVLSQNCNKISIDREIMLPEFLCMYLQVQSAKIQLQEKTTDTVRQFLSLTNLKKTLIPVPPKDEQIEIIGRISNLFAFIDKVNMGSVISTELIERLSSSLLTKAFTDGLR